jgi:hypothetical protein
MQGRTLAWRRAGAAAAISLAAAAHAQVYSSAAGSLIGEAATMQNTIHIDGGPSSITGLRVVIQATHSSDGDLDIALVHNGAYVRLSSACGGGGQNYLTTRFRDDAPDFIGEGAAPFNGDFRPDGGILDAAFNATIALPSTALGGLWGWNAQSAAGDWTLWIDDAVNNGLTGVLSYWSLEFNGATDPNGPYGMAPPPPPPPTCGEAGDAGETLATAQVTSGYGTLARIEGTLSWGDTDMYAINICDRASFSATTVGGSSVDTRLWLFDSLGRGITANDDEPSGNTAQSTITGVWVPANGLYYLAVTAYDRYPLDPAGNRIWLESTGETSERVPDGPGAPYPLTSWTGAYPGGGYRMMLTGACFAQPRCGSADFNCDGSIGTDADIAAFFQCLAGSCPGGSCPSTADFDGDGASGTDADVEAFFRVLAGGPC